MENMFWEGLSLASELGAMDQKRLGNETRHEEEIAARRSLEATFAKRHEELTRRLNAFDQALQSDVSELIEHLRTGEVDFAAEAQDAIGGTSSNIAEAAGYVSLLLMSAEIGEMPIDGQTIKRLHMTESEINIIQSFVDEAAAGYGVNLDRSRRSEEHTSDLQSLMRNAYAVFCLKKKKLQYKRHNTNTH